MQQVEREVDKHYLNNLMNECRREKVTQRQMMQEARCARTAADGAEPLPLFREAGVAAAVLRCGEP